MNKLNSSPWDTSLEQRISEFHTAKDSGKKVALILYSDDNKASSFRYRGYNVYQATKASKSWQLTYLFMSELSSAFKLVKDTDLLIFGRIDKWTPELDELALLAKNHGAKVLQDLDDCVCGPYYIKDAFNLISPDFADQEYWINTCAHYELISYLCDGFLVTNDYLGKKLSYAHEKKPFRVIKNFLNQEQINHAEELNNEKYSNSNGTFTIGYFSGSHTHAADFEVIFPELMDFLDINRDATLKIVGYMQLPSSASKYIDRGQIVQIPIVDFLKLEELVSAVDVNLAPLDDNIFANCKSDLKFYEAALVKTPTIASPTYVFKKAIKNGETGFLCRPGEWYNVLQKLHDNPVLGQRIAGRAYQYCLENYSPKKCLAEIEDAYDFFA
ncbi:glycosyltransferase [Candidatus Saccharibacteria bacterium]|nr:glycosyltransferase [Candidatus Saccharibacteria bacterium]